MNFVKYIGIPFVDGGRDLNGLDCWGLVKLIYKEQYNIDLPEYYISAMATVSITAEMRAEEHKWIKLEQPEAPCLVVINLTCGPWADHVGVYLGVGKFIHCYKRSGVVIDRLSHWQSRIIGYYKPGWLHD